MHCSPTHKLVTIPLYLGIRPLYENRRQGLAVTWRKPSNPSTPLALMTATPTASQVSLPWNGNPVGELLSVLG